MLPVMAPECLIYPDKSSVTDSLRFAHRPPPTTLLVASWQLAQARRVRCSHQKPQPPQIGAARTAIRTARDNRSFLAAVARGCPDAPAGLPPTEESCRPA